MCGADGLFFFSVIQEEGSPPRVRSRPPIRPSPAYGHGITSACAEQTLSHQSLTALHGDHLRVCGADRPAGPEPAQPAGSPPRVRSRLGECHALRRPRGITSACAEQTMIHSWGCWPVRDHLRVCGADPASATSRQPDGGSPPRVRSRRVSLPNTATVIGITSACAEQTPDVRVPRQAFGDHLRVCGADNTCMNSLRTCVGSPPRVRSRRPCRSFPMS